MTFNGEPRQILPDLFAKIRKEPGWVACENAFDEFRDTGPRKEQGFINDIELALNDGKFGPSWKPFINAILAGEIIIIITSRGHSQKTLREGVKYIIETYLTVRQRETMFLNIMYLLGLFKDDKFGPEKLVDRYLDYCMFMGIYSKDFVEQFGYEAVVQHPEEAKELVANHYLTIINEQNQKLGYKFSVGFSDDDKGNVQQIKKFFKKSSWSNVADLYVYDTSNPKRVVKTKY
jgi:hypothetical protein